jgi:hypothetical protein
MLVIELALVKKNSCSRPGRPIVVRLDGEFGMDAGAGMPNAQEPGMVRATA